MKTIQEVIQDPKKLVLLIICSVLLLGSLIYIVFMASTTERITTITYTTRNGSFVCNETYINGLLVTDMCLENVLTPMVNNLNNSFNFSQWNFTKTS